MRDANQFASLTARRAAWDRLWRILLGEHRDPAPYRDAQDASASDDTAVETEPAAGEDRRERV